MSSDVPEFPTVENNAEPSVSRLAIKYEPDRLIIVYSPMNGVDFIDINLQGSRGEEAEQKIKRIFSFRRSDAIDLGDSNKASRSFVLGKTDPENSEYYRIDGRILNMDNDLLIYKRTKIDINWFAPIQSYKYGVITIFDKIDRLVSENIVIGGNLERAIPEAEWNAIVDNFPSQTEISHYYNSRVQALLEDYFTTMPDSKSKLVKYIEKREVARASRNSANGFDAYDKGISKFEVEKYSSLVERLEELLANEAVSEKDWEREILKMIMLLYPKYVAIIPQMKITENLTKSDGRPTERYFDIVLVDADGHLDLVEIKKPSASSIFRNVTDHDNAVPSLSLTKAVMQMEKYILYLQKGGYTLEKRLNEKYGDRLPNKIKIRVVNPKGILILGRRTRSKAFETDFEVLRRKYANILDILTYDDLISNFKNIISRFKGE